MAQHLVTSQAAAAELGVSGQRIRQLLLAGRVRGAVRVGNTWVIPSPVRLTPATRGPVGVAGRKAMPLDSRKRGK